MPIVTLISFRVGAILAFIGAVQLQQFGAQIYVDNLVGLAMADDFNATHLDPDKWFGVEHSLPGGAGTEVLRQIQEHRL